MAWFNTLEPHWMWMTIGVILAAAEIIIPGFFLIWLALAAVLAGLLAWAIPMSFAVQMLIFATLAVAAVYAGRRWFALNPIETSDPNLNNRGARLIGESVVVVEAIVGGHGRVRVGDTEWSAKGSDAAVGARVTVTGSDGSMLLVAPS
jgi:inner membrane protein